MKQLDQFKRLITIQTEIRRILAKEQERLRGSRRQGVQLFARKEGFRDAPEGLA
jgi:hypothetical protein